MRGGGGGFTDPGSPGQRGRYNAFLRFQYAGWKKEKKKKKKKKKKKNTHTTAAEEDPY